MDGIKRKESGASEVIGAVLLVSLVVIGGAVVAAFVFGQPAPKEVPHVSSASPWTNPRNLTLHHTGGDTLLPENIMSPGARRRSRHDGAIVEGSGKGSWSSDGDLTIPGVAQRWERSC